MASPFGAAPTFGSPFQAAAPSPGGFGQTPASPFGAASTPGFGQAATAGAFGTPATGTSLFGASPSPFGANSTPNLFGANSTPSAFGASTAPSLFGASSTPGFGTSAFGSTSSPSLFASSTGATQSAFGSSLFGANTGGAATTSSLFGGLTASTGALTTGTTGSLWGGTQFAGSTFGAQNQLQPALQVPQQTDSAIKEVTEIKAAYTPGSHTYRFTHLLLNVVDNPAQRAKPPNIDEMRWRQAMAAAGGPDNPDRLWPIAATGFKDLLARSAVQASAVDENAARLKALQDLAYKLARRQGLELKQRATAIQSQHLELSSRLLRACRMIDGLESRLAATMGYRADVAKARGDKLSRQLREIEAELAPNSLTGLTKRLSIVATTAQVKAAAPVVGSGAQAEKLDERSAANLLNVLKDHADAVAKLQVLLKRDALDVAIMQQELESEAQGGPGHRMLLLE